MSDDQLLAELAFSPWERLAASARGPAWASGLLGMDVDGLALACSAGASLAVSEAQAVPEYISDDVSDAVDALEVDTASFEEVQGQRTIRVDSSLEWVMRDEDVTEVTR